MRPGTQSETDKQSRRLRLMVAGCPGASRLPITKAFFAVIDARRPNINLCAVIWCGNLPADNVPRKGEAKKSHLGWARVIMPRAMGSILGSPQRQTINLRGGQCVRLGGLWFGFVIEFSGVPHPILFMTCFRLVGGGKWIIHAHL